MASHAGPSRLATSLTDLLVLCSGYQGNALRRLDGLCVGEFDLWSPHRAGDVNPVVVGSSLEGFPRVDRPTTVFLLLAIVVCCLSRLLDLELLPLPLLVGHLLLVMGELRGSYKVVLGLLHRA